MKRVLVWVTAAAMSLSLIACGNNEAEGEASVQSVSAICGYGSVGLADRFSGIVASRSQVEIKKNENMSVDQVLVEVGDQVEEGQVLFIYDSVDAKLSRDKAKLELEQLKNGIETKKSQIKQLEKDKKNASSDQKLSYSIEIQELEADIQESTYNIAVKEKEIEKLNGMLKNLEVKSTVNGVVQSIQSNDENMEYGYDGQQSNAFMVITETGFYRVKGYINETNAGALMEGMPVIIRSRVNEQTWTGSISGIDWDQPEQGNQNMYYDGGNDEMSSSSKYPFYVELDDIEGLLLGQHVYIEPDFGQDDAGDEQLIELASWYINDVDGKAWVWAENSKGKLEKKSVKLGAHNEDMDTWVIESGLTLDDYIAFPDESLKAGMSCIEYNDAAMPFGSLYDDTGITYEESGDYEGAEGYEEFEEGGNFEEGEVLEESVEESTEETGE